MLYLVSTPIGNLKDISLRAIEVLRSVDCVLCEDTRHSSHLLRHYEISTVTLSYHQFNEAKRGEEILERLKKGQMIALISDAGTPGISDPGERLVRRCVEEGVAVQSIPGACAALAALVCSGLTTERFQFLGFLPKKKKERESVLEESLHYPGTSIVYESPKRLLATLEILEKIDARRSVVVARELTKKFEEILRGTPRELLHHWKEEAPRGEVVLLLSPGNPELKTSWWETLSPIEHVAHVMNENPQLSKKEACSLVAKERGLSSRSVYRDLHKK